MNTAYFIANRLVYRLTKEDNSISRPAVSVAIAGISIGFVVMLLTLFIVIGFKREITAKAIGFGCHIQVVNFDNNSTYQLKPVVVSDSMLQTLKHIENVRNVVPFCTKPGIIKTDSAFQGVVIKGRKLQRTGTDNTDSDFFEQNLVMGRMPEARNEIIISSELSNILGLETKDSCFCYFIDNTVRARKYHITGMYDSQFSDFDRLFVIGDFKEVQRLNDFEEDEVSGVEIIVNDIKNIDEVADMVYLHTANHPDRNGNMLYTQTIEEQQPGIFAWLKLLDMNVMIILLLMMSVSAFCIISGLIVIILDSISLIGTLKAMGADNILLKKVFLYQSANLIGKGLIIGNVIGLVISLAQYFLHIIPLDQATYYISYVPIALSPIAWLLLNLSTALISMLVLLAPASIVTRISPAQVMRFE